MASALEPTLRSRNPLASDAEIGAMLRVCKDPVSCGAKSVGELVQLLLVGEIVFRCETVGDAVFIEILDGNADAFAVMVVPQHGPVRGYLRTAEDRT